MAKVLITDDEPGLRRLWALNLAARNYSVVQASNGRECLRLVEAESPNLILLDLTMPVLSGWQILETLKGSPFASQTPIIVLTGWADVEVRVQAHKLGAADTLVKPFGVEKLLRSVELALQGVCHEREKFSWWTTTQAC